MADWIASTIIDSSISDADSDVPEYKMVETSIVQLLRTNAFFKTFLVASDRNMFKYYYPTMKQHHLIFQKGNQRIAEAIRTKFPSLITDGNLSKYHASELGHVIDAIGKAAQKQMSFARLNATVENEVITLMIQQWKGKTVEGLDAIISAIERFESRYPAEKHLYPVPLMSLLNNFSGLGERLITNWHNQNFLKSQPASNVQVIKKFGEDLLPILNVHAQERYCSQTSVLSRLAQAYDTKLENQKYAQDFATVSVLDE